MPRQRSSILVLIAMPPTTKLNDEPRSFARLYITDRQIEILSWVGQGKSARDIGDILGISRRTVEHQLEKAYASLEVRTRFQAVLKARDLGLIGDVSG